ncbi:MAG: hypothetical protein A2W23_08340 [Planctomycetes bacterium RBG_16_43_13]|nr:MAG: hypothetical protein A2W23_08340 [Planctomycetes bacterium RBG_16_43_13]
MLEKASAGYPGGTFLLVLPAIIFLIFIKVLSLKFRLYIQIRVDSKTENLLFLYLERGDCMKMWRHLP